MKNLTKEEYELLFSLLKKYQSEFTFQSPEVINKFDNLAQKLDQKNICSPFPKSFISTKYKLSDFPVGADIYHKRWKWGTVVKIDTEYKAIYIDFGTVGQKLIAIEMFNNPLSF